MFIKKDLSFKLSSMDTHQDTKYRRMLSAIGLIDHQWQMLLEFIRLKDQL